MANFQQFELSDSFTALNYQKLPDSMRFDRSIKEEGKLYRLLIGSATIKNNVTGDVFKQKVNYSILEKKDVPRFTKSMFIEYLPTGTNLNHIDEYLKRSNPRNIALFRDLTHEFCYYFFYKEKGIHTLSFLYLYRILERISYTFPMLYASKATDYMGTFSKLQNYFKESNSELKFLSLFLTDFFEDQHLEYPVKLNITAFNIEIRESYYKILKTLCNSNNPVIAIKDFNEHTDITIENKDTFHLMIHLRNRYFHFLSGGSRNITSNEMIEPNDFFGIVNEHFANWLAVVYFQIVKNAAV